MCMMACPYGYAKDMATECDTCQCYQPCQVMLRVSRICKVNLWVSNVTDKCVSSQVTLFNQCQVTLFNQCYHMSGGVVGVMSLALIYNT